jgi:hypothetical protein
VTLRNEAEKVIRAWDAYEIERGASPVIDYDCHPEDKQITPATSRLGVYRELALLQLKAEESGNSGLVQRLKADLTYLGALLGEHLPLADYVRATQGCAAAGWPKEYVSECAEVARKSMDALGISWGPNLSADLDELGGKIDAADAPDAIRQAATDYETAVREATGTDAPYELVIETTDVDAYWGYWLDGAGQRVRLRLNLRNAHFTHVECRQFALHEILGHGLQNASFAARCANEDVPWFRLMSVHAPQQVMLEGLAEAMPLFITPDDESLTARVRLNRYTQLARAGMHLALDSDTIIEEIASRASTQVPWWTEAQISDILTDRGANPQLRSYLWSYPAGLDWFAALADAGSDVTRQVLQAAYREPLSPADLAALWPTGPPIGGPGPTT